MLSFPREKLERGALEEEGARGILQRSSGISETLICCRYAVRRAAVSPLFFRQRAVFVKTYQKFRISSTEL
ncbi:hypothetical protein K1719_019031 [Acacia pycnantha]|nr:hypothetical protein K1719_019031 [Acacia pycnantha]